jgi:NAD(P)-dependent dehydrogenase (short-subunit alcohol dehydrogenase family)
VSDGSLDTNATEGGRLAGRSAIVTGAAGGQGVAVARRFLVEGARVLLTDSARERLERLHEELGGAFGDSSVTSIAADVSDERDVEQMVGAAVEAFGGIDIVHNNAGVRFAGRDSAVDRLERDVWERTIAVNLTGAYLVCKHAIPHLLGSPAGVIVNVSSTAGIGGDPEAHAYGASKGGLISLTLGIAQRYGPHGLRAVVLCPGLVDTPMLHEALAGEEITQKLVETTALRRIATPEEVASYAAFLASDDARFVTSCVVRCDGGLVK